MTGVERGDRYDAGPAVGGYYVRVPRQFLKLMRAHVQGTSHQGVFVFGGVISSSFFLQNLVKMGKGRAKQ